MAAIQVDDSVKDAADMLFSSIGLDTSTAVNMFLTASLESNGLPFTVKPHMTEPANPREAMFGCMRGKMQIADDFDAPIEGMEWAYE